MTIKGRFYTLSLLAGLILLTSSAFALQLPQPILETDWLAKNISNEKMVILDVRKNVDSFFAAHEENEGKSEKINGHIESARLWDWHDVRTDRIINGVELHGVLPTKIQFEEIMKNFGINNDSAVIIVSNWTDKSNVTFATRAYWTLKYFGHDNVALLNGGTAKWIAEKRPLEYSQGPIKQKIKFRSKTERRDILADTLEVAAALKNKDIQLIDGRTQDYFYGEKKKPYVFAAGHIPKSTNIGVAELVDKQTKSLKPLSELKELFASNNIDINGPAIVYCDSGHLSTGLWFVLHELANNKNVKLFDGSMNEWTKDAKRPVTVSVN